MKKTIAGFILLLMCNFIIAQNVPPSISHMSIKSTNVATYVTGTTAVSGATVVTSDGGASNIKRGVCWSTDSIPTAKDFITSEGTGDGTFLSVMIDLTPYTWYYVRSYMIYDLGAKIDTVYGPQISFMTTNFIPPFSYLIAIIEQSAPDVIEVVYNYDATTENISLSGFEVIVNSVQVPIISMNINKNKIFLQLDRELKTEDIVLLSYTMPIENSIVTPTTQKGISTSYFEVFINIIH